MAYDPIELHAAMERVVVKGNKRKYRRLARPLRFYGGIISSEEVGCGLRCLHCFSHKPVWKPGSTGKFYSPEQVFNALDASARKHGHKIISASASEGTIGRQHLEELLTLVDRSDYRFVLETNGMILGHDREYVRSLARFNHTHVRVSIKCTNPEEYARLTGATPESYELPYKALRYLIDDGVSCNACVMVSFSTEEGIEEAKARLAAVHPGILKSLELENITLFPKVAERLARKGITPRTIRHRGRIITLDTESGNPSWAG